MRRQDTRSIGRQAEDLAADLLRQRGFAVRNLNEERFNHPLYDLVAVKNGNEILVSVKCARAKRELRVGIPEMLREIRDDFVVMAFLPVSKSKEIEFSPGGYEVLIIPGCIAREEGLAVHDHYIAAHRGSADHSVMVKDKVDRNEGTRSGAVFKSWHERFLNAWSTFDAVVQSRG
ncbi:MAG TPA: hypothetical protein VHK45_11670 [Geminicoccaceae bacterium]|nr:hypothetical protein [Geminicoccaceae bacterium]